MRRGEEKNKFSISPAACSVIAKRDQIIKYSTTDFGERESFVDL